MGTRLGSAPFVILLFVALGTGQAQEPRFAVGATLTVISRDAQTKVGELGGHFGYRLNRRWALDADVGHNPGFGDGPHGETLGLYGVRAGTKLWDRVTIFAKARPGFVHCGGPYCLSEFEHQENYFAFDIGGGIEYYPPRRRTYWRIDIGDTIIPYGNATVTGYPGPAVGTRHQKTVAIGFGIRF